MAGEPHRGQRTARRRRGRGSAGRARDRGPTCAGGAMPCSASLRRPAFGDPVGAPRRGQHGADLDAPVPGAGQRRAQVVAHLLEGRAARVGRGDRHGDRVRRRPRPPRTTPRSSRVSIGISGSATVATTSRARARVPRRAHQVAPGCWRARLCISASSGPRCSVCRPCRPPRPPIVPAGATCGRDSVARGEHLVEDAVDLLAGLRRVDGDPGGGQPALDVRGAEQLVDVGQTASSAACMRRCDSAGAVAEPQRPARGVVAVVGELLDALARDRGEHRVARSRAAGAAAPAARSRTAAGGRSRGRSRGRRAARRARRCGTPPRRRR